MGSCIYPGSFDPVTKGHQDIIARTSVLFDHVYVALLQNAAKKYMYNMQERLTMLQAATKQYPNVTVVGSDGLLADMMKNVGTKTIIRGLRSNADLEYEQQMAVVNYQLAGAETVVLLSKPEMQYVSSSIVRELISYQADVSAYVPEEIQELIYGRKTI